ncbi:MAG TPA: CAP domain-containing protein [Candidatus Elarobacter sp.]|nr:CAP domain-containing protein [Candidatus Elarobacter sp.]
MTPLVAMMAAIGLSPILVGAYQAQDVPIALAFVNPHQPVALVDEARTLAGDVNAERAKRGLPVLQRDEALDKFAYAKAVEMAARGYFGHTDPDGITFEDRLRAWHWPTTYAGENIAYDTDERHAHAAFMNSPEHAHNVLDPRESRLGVAVVTVGADETFYVEDFSAR